MYSDVLHIRLCRLCDMYHLPYPHPCMCHPFVYLFVCLSWFTSVTCCLPCLFVFPPLIASFIDRQQADDKSVCTHSIRRGLGRRLRSSLLLNSSPRFDLPL